MKHKLREVISDFISFCMVCFAIGVGICIVLSVVFSFTYLIELVFG